MKQSKIHVTKMIKQKSCLAEFKVTKRDNTTKRQKVK